EDVALIAFTSGTTGKPKGTMHFHRDVVAMCDCFPRSCLKPTRDDIFIGSPPLAFTFGLGGLLCFPLRFGASTALVEKFTPDTMLDAIQKFKATILFTAPTMYRALAPIWHNYDLGRLQHRRAGGRRRAAVASGCGGVRRCGTAGRGTGHDRQGFCGFEKRFLRR